MFATPQGTDGRERGEEDVAFEKQARPPPAGLAHSLLTDGHPPHQTALFAMASADVLLVNMWCHDIGREHGAGKPLLRTVFQVNLKLFSPRRTLLVFVIRDRTRTPAELLTETLRADLERIWQGISKPEKHTGASLGDFFEVRYLFLPNYEERTEEFCAEVTQLALRLTSREAADSLAAPAGAGVPGDALTLSMRAIWTAVKENRDLDLPAHRVMVATVRCEQIAAAALAASTSSEAFISLGGSDEAPMSGLGARVAALLSGCLRSYDAEAELFEPTVRAAKREQLRCELLDAAAGAHGAALAAARAQLLFAAKGSLQAALSRGDGFTDAAAAAREQAARAWGAAAADACPAEATAEWAPRAAAVRAKLLRDVDAHVASERKAAMEARRQEVGARALRRLSPAAVALLDAPPADLWPALRALLADETSKAEAALTEAVRGFGAAADAAESAGGVLSGELRAQLARTVEEKAREASAGCVARLKERFGEAFSRDDKGLPRVWRPADDIDASASSARAAAVGVLALLAVLRLDASLDEPAHAATSSLRVLAADVPSGEPLPAQLMAPSWEAIPVDAELLTPPACRAAWRSFSADVAYSLLQARAAQDAARRAAASAPPLWAMAAMVVLGFDELLWLLRSPVTLLCLGCALLFARALYAQMDVESTVAALGWLPSLAVLGARLVPAAVAVLSKLLEAGMAAGTPTQPVPAVQRRDEQREESVGSAATLRKKDE